MAYTEWQLNRIREALKAHHNYSYTHVAVGGDGKISTEYFSWNSVSEAIAEMTGETISGERLRSFIEGEMRKGVRAWPIPNKIDSIIEFLMHEDIDLLSSSELSQASPAIHAPIRLMEYLCSEYVNIEDKSCASISGSFHFTFLNDDEIVLHEIRIVPSDNNGLLQVHEKYTYFDEKYSDEFSEWSESEREEYFYSKKKYSGWAIFTPEESLIFFMKDNSTGRNHYYFTLAADKELTSSTEMNTFCLISLDYPIKIPPVFDDSRQVVRRLFSDYSGNARIFTRNKKLMSDEDEVA